MKIQADISKDANKFLKIEKVKRGLPTLGVTLSKVLEEYIIAIKSNKEVRIK